MEELEEQDEPLSPRTERRRALQGNAMVEFTIAQHKLANGYRTTVTDDVDLDVGIRLHEGKSSYGLIIADCSNQRIVHWRNGGNTGSVIAGGIGPGKSSECHIRHSKCFCLDRDGTVYIADRGNQRIVAWSPQASVACEQIRLIEDQQQSQTNRELAAKKEKDDKRASSRQRKRLKNVQEKETKRRDVNVKRRLSVCESQADSSTSSEAESADEEEECRRQAEAAASRGRSGTTKIKVGEIGLLVQKTVKTIVVRTDSRDVGRKGTCDELVSEKPVWEMSEKIGSELKKKADFNKRHHVSVLPARVECGRLGQMLGPHCVQVDGTYIYASFWNNHSIVRFCKGTKEGQIVAGGNGAGSENRHLNCPQGFILDAQGGVIVADSRNHRVMWWKRNATEGIPMAGDNGRGECYGQLDLPCAVGMDSESSLYVSDTGNHRVVMWKPGSRTGMVIAGGNNPGSRADQLNTPHGIAVDSDGTSVYIADSGNHRIMRWMHKEGGRAGFCVAGGRDMGRGRKITQLDSPMWIEFDTVYRDMPTEDMLRAAVQKTVAATAQSTGTPAQQRPSSAAPPSLSGRSSPQNEIQRSKERKPTSPAGSPTGRRSGVSADVFKDIEAANDGLDAVERRSSPTSWNAVKTAVKNNLVGFSEPESYSRKVSPSRRATPSAPSMPSPSAPPSRRGLFFCRQKSPDSKQPNGKNLQIEVDIANGFQRSTSPATPKFVDPRENEKKRPQMGWAHAKSILSTREAIRKPKTNSFQTLALQDVGVNDCDIKKKAATMEWAAAAAPKKPPSKDLPSPPLKSGSAAERFARAARAARLRKYSKDSNYSAGSPSPSQPPTPGRARQEARRPTQGDDCAVERGDGVQGQSSQEGLTRDDSDQLVQAAQGAVVAKKKAPSLWKKAGAMATMMSSPKNNAPETRVSWVDGNLLLSLAKGNTGHIRNLERVGTWTTAEMDKAWSSLTSNCATGNTLVMHYTSFESYELIAGGAGIWACDQGLLHVSLGSPAELGWTQFGDAPWSIDFGKHLWQSDWEKVQPGAADAAKIEIGIIAELRTGSVRVNPKATMAATLKQNCLDLDSRGVSRTRYCLKNTAVFMVWDFRVVEADREQHSRKQVEALLEQLDAVVKQSKEADVGIDAEEATPHEREKREKQRKAHQIDALSLLRKNGKFLPDQQSHRAPEETSPRSRSTSRKTTDLPTLQDQSAIVQALQAGKELSGKNEPVLQPAGFASRLRKAAADTIKKKRQAEAGRGGASPQSEPGSRKSTVSADHQKAFGG